MALFLIIDDDPAVHRLLGAHLKRRGHTWVSLGNGAGVLEAVRSARPDIVVLDIMMPGLSGGDLYQLLRKEWGAQLPVILSSSSRLRVAPEGQDPRMAVCPKGEGYDKLLGMGERLLRESAGETGAGSMPAEWMADLDGMDEGE